ncbi:MAG TPA: chitobiase/beta-hexosaminidase C-terminal domain-containing protein, partial [Kofleriaceae bacterium]|nr:chitobiase/beta-hexosaminidase C-terminal domain-containing protein [Kofleriaceae bacterium]
MRTRSNRLPHPVPRNPRRPGKFARLALAASLALLVVIAGGGSATAATDFTQSVTQLNASQVRVSFTPTTPSTFVDIHYLPPAIGQQNVRMTNHAGTWQLTIGSLTSGFVLEYWFTYDRNGPAFDTPHFTFTVGGSAGTVATPTFSPAGGSFSTAQTVTITTATAGASIRFTVDGSTPTASSPLFSGPISVTSSQTINAIGLLSGLANSAVASASYTIGAATGCPTQSDIPNFGPNVRIFATTMSTATIQAQLDADFNAQKDTLTAQMGTGRVAHLFKPGSYSVHDNVGFYTSVAGLGQNPDDVTINGDVTVDAFNASDQGVALQNFWRSAENLAINPSNGADRWAVAQAAPFRRIDVHGNLLLFPASFGFASGGYIADTKVSGQTSSVSQQQWYTR